MNLNRHKPSQFELFPSAKKNSAETVRPMGPFKSLTLSLENIIVMSIMFVVCTVLFYSFGYEKGKRAYVQAGNTVDVATGADEDYELIVQPLGEETATETVQVVEPEKVREEKIEVLEIPIDPKIVERNFTIQVASFKQEKSAKQEAKTLEKKGYETEVLRKGNYSIVCVGRFAEQRQARAYTSKLKKHYKDLLVRRL